MSDPLSATLVAKDEETWFAQWQRSRGFRDSGNEEEFVKTALEAFRLRPHRAEPLHDLARYYLGKSRGDIAIVYADAGLPLQFPEGDHLGVEGAVYHTSLKEAFTIAASYSKDPEEKERGRVICNWLSLSGDVPDWVRGLAQLNYNWYAEPARAIMPSIQFFPVSIEAPEGFKPGNISIARERNGFVVLIRAVNYDKLESGFFDRHGDTSFRQRTLLAHLDEHLQITSSVEVFPPEDMPPAQHTDSIGFEDPRPIIWRGGLWCISSLRQLNPDGRAEMVLARIAEVAQGKKVLTDWRVLVSGMPVQWEKNWMPQVIGDELRFIYSVGPTRILSEAGDVLVQEAPSIAVENFRGGSQAIPFDGGWLMVIHEWEVVGRVRRYFHRFIWFDENNRLSRISRRFFFQRIASEFVAGLAWHVTGDRLVVSFGIDDHEPTLAVVQASDVRAALLGFDEHKRASEQACEAGRSEWEGRDYGGPAILGSRFEFVTNNVLGPTELNTHLIVAELSTNNSVVDKVKEALSRALAGAGKLGQDILDIEGMSGHKYRLFINNLIESLENPRYLEVGVWAGSTLCSAIYKNRVRTTAIDNWSEFNGPFDKFFHNLARFKGPGASVSFIERNFRDVNFAALGKFNVYLFDGPHSAQDQYDGVTIAQPALDDQFVLIVDDWNWKQVREGTQKGLQDARVSIDYKAEIRTTLDNSHPAVSGSCSDWHNGYFVAVLSKERP